MAASDSAEVVVVGAGLIGTSIAWRLAQAGLDVALVIGEREAAASRVAAGMLAPVSETTFTEQPLLHLNLASADLFPDFVAGVEETAEATVGLRRAPTLSVAYDADDAARLDAFADFLERSGLPCQRLTGRDCRHHEPLLAPAVRAGLLVERDWSCDNRLLLSALIVAARRAGARELPGFVHGVQSRDGRATAVELADGSKIDARWIVIANGAWASQITGIPSLPVRPVKGQILRLGPSRLPSPSVTVRAFSRGAEIYLVPRESGREVVVGATVEELGFDRRATAGGVYELLRDARSVLPMTAEYALVEISVGWRPGTSDNAPILGGCSLRGLIVATGHYRNGVLLTPITAEVISKLIMTGELDPIAAAFTLDRFARTRNRV
jgi:glycine oxidase